MAELIAFGARVSYGPGSDDEQLEEVLARLVVAAADGGDAPDRAVGGAAIGLYQVLWNGGWLPLDLVHVVRRELGAKGARMAAELILDDRSLRAPDRPSEWDDQLGGVAAATNGRFVASVSAVERWRRGEKVALGDALRIALQIMGFVVQLPRIPVILVPPREWAAHRGAVLRTRSPAGAIDAKVVEKIRALLAKAERTDFPAEAEAFTSKAQELMSRHEIDSAMLAASDRSGDLAGEVRSRRIHIDNPYAVEKAQLLGAVAASNSGRVVWDEQHGWATIVGFPVDLDLTELLFTSLLIQLTRAIAEAARSGGRAKSPSFRRAFVLSYASRIGERLSEARHQARDDASQVYGTALVPVLAARTEAVDQVTEQIFPRLQQSRARRVDAQGWRAGRLAADIASLHTGTGSIHG